MPDAVAPLSLLENRTASGLLTDVASDEVVVEPVHLAEGLVLTDILACTTKDGGPLEPVLPRRYPLRDVARELLDLGEALGHLGSRRPRRTQVLADGCLGDPKLLRDLRLLHLVLAREFLHHCRPEAW